MESDYNSDGKDVPSIIIEIVEIEKTVTVIFPSTELTRPSPDIVLEPTPNVPEPITPSPEIIIPNPGTCVSRVIRKIVSEPFKQYVSDWYGFLRRRNYVWVSDVVLVIQTDCKYSDGTTSQELKNVNAARHQYTVEGGMYYMEYENPILEFLNKYQIPLTASVGLDGHVPTSFSIMGFTVIPAKEGEMEPQEGDTTQSDAFVGNKDSVDVADQNGGETALIVSDQVASLQETTLMSIPLSNRIAPNQIYSRLTELTGQSAGSRVKLDVSNYMDILEGLDEYGYIQRDYIFQTLDFNNYDYYVVLYYAPGSESLNVEGFLRD